MVTVIAAFRAQAGMGDAVIDALAKEAEQARQEPGNSRFDLFRNVTDPSTILIFEQYADQAALDEHSSKDYAKAVYPVIKPLLAGRPEVSVFHDTK